MKKAAVICLLLIASFAAFASDWTIEHFLDVFGDEMEQFYITPGLETGTYSDDIDTDSPLNWKLLVTENHVGFKLYKNGTQIAKANSSYDSDLSIILRDDNGVDYYFTADFIDTIVAVEDSEATSLLRLLAINKSPRIVIYEFREDSYKIRSTFKLGVVPNVGLTEFYKETYGVDWSLPLTITLSDEVVNVPMYSDDIKSIGVDVCLGTEKIDCQYQVDFDWDLTRSIGDDWGFNDYSYHYDNSNSEQWKRDYSHIYLNHYKDLTTKRSGYVTVQLGEVTEKCLVEVVANTPVQKEPVQTVQEESVQTVEIPEETEIQTVAETTDSSASSEIIEPAVDNPEDFILTKVYRNGDLMITAELKNTSATVKFNIEDEEILELITWLAEEYPEDTAGVSYTLKDSVLNVSYPEMTEDEADDTWKLLKFALNTYYLTLEEKTKVEAETEAAEEPVAKVAEAHETEDTKEERFADGSDEEKEKATTVQAVVEKETEAVSAPKTIIEKPFIMRGRADLRPSMGYTGKTIEGTYRGTTKTGENKSHMLEATMMEARFFVSNNLFLSLSGGLSFYSYSFNEQVQIGYKETTNSYNDIVIGGLVELGVGYQKGNVFGDIRIGVVKTFFKPNYNENLNITAACVFGFYYVEIGLGLDYNIEENRIRPQIVFSLSTPIFYLSNKNGEKQWMGF